MMAPLILGGAVLFAMAFIVIRRIIRLPSRYERKPQVLSPWSSLDQGIDPSIPQENDQ
jgi:hypothetical protein